MDNFLDNLTKDFGELIDSLSLINRYNLVRLDNNILLFALKNEEEVKEILEGNNTSNKKNKTKFKVKLNSYKMMERGEFMAFSKNGLLFNEVVNMVARLQDSSGKLVGYAFQLRDVSLVKKEFSFFDLDSNNNSVIIFMLGENGLEDGYFICNNIDDDIIKDSCAEVHEDLKLVNINGEYLLTFNKKRYHFSNAVWTENEANRTFSNIGKFVYEA